MDALDFLAIVAQWGSPCSGACTADITGPTPLALDLLVLLSQWGLASCGG